MQIFFVLFALLAVGLFGWFAIRPWYDFLIQITPHQISFKGNFPPEHRATIRQFFSQDLALPGSYRVLGRWRPGRVLELRFRGDLPPFHQQRIRNFLAMTFKSGRRS